jgi:hypothetical protein
MEISKFGGISVIRGFQVFSQVGQRLFLANAAQRPNYRVS